MASRHQAQKGSRFWRRLLIIIALVLPTIIVLLIAAQHLPDTSKASRSAVALKKQAPVSLALPGDFTLQDKVGQLLMVGVSSRATAVNMEKKYQIGGFLLRPDSDLFSKNSSKTIREAGKLPPLMAVDEEGGQVARLPGSDFSGYSASYMGGLPDAQVEQIGHQMGQAMAAVGANLDFAPVVDIDDGQNAAISQLDRSFSADPTVIAAKAGAFAAGLRQAGIIPTFKHFPGLGNAGGPTGGNTDDGPATTPSLTYLKHNDLIPYKTLLAMPVSSVMVGNQIVPGLTGGQPASLSGATYNLLRADYGFNGVVFTDELILAKAVADTEPGPADAVIAALKAGADMPLVDTDDSGTVANIIDSVTVAVHDGRIKPAQIDVSLKRVLQLKANLKP